MKKKAIKTTISARHRRSLERAVLDSFAHRELPWKAKGSPFKAGTGLGGGTEPGQKVTTKNADFLPPGSVVRLADGSRLIHLHDSLWLWCCDTAWCYARLDAHRWRLKGGRAVLCHIPAG